MQHSSSSGGSGVVLYVSSCSSYIITVSVKSINIIIVRINNIC